MRSLITNLLIASGIAIQAQVIHQNTLEDSIDKVVKKKQLEVLEQELELKSKEYDIKVKQLELDQKKYSVEEAEKEKEAKERIEQEKFYESERKKREEEIKKQEEESMKFKNFNTLISVEPLPLFIGTFQFGIEKKIMDKRTLRLSVGYTNTDDPVFYENTKQLEGFKLELQYKYYVQTEENGTSGFYVGAYGMLKNLTRQVHEDLNTFPTKTFNDYTIEGKMAGFGVLVGYNLFFINRLSSDVFVGAGFNRQITDYDSSELGLRGINSFANGTIIRFGMSFGLAIKK